MQGKTKFTVDPELQRRLENYKSLEDFRLAVSSTKISLSHYSLCILACSSLEQQGLASPSSVSSPKSPHSSTASSSSKVSLSLSQHYSLCILVSSLEQQGLASPSSVSSPKSPHLSTASKVSLSLSLSLTQHTYSHTHKLSLLQRSSAANPPASSQRHPQTPADPPSLPPPSH